MTSRQKLDAIRIYLDWDITDAAVAMEVINKIWHVVNEDRIII